MQRVFYLLILALILMISGCDSSEPTKAQAPPATPKPTVSAEEKAPAPPVAEADKAPAAAQTTDTSVAAGSDKVQENAVPATATTTEVATAADKTGTAVASAVTKPATNVPQELVLQASYGNVTFPHGMHADAYKCSTCHGDKTPALFGLTKEVAHVLCKDCHKKEGAPNGCNDCHKK